MMLVRRPRFSCGSHVRPAREDSAAPERDSTLLYSGVSWRSACLSDTRRFMMRKCGSGRVSALVAANHRRTCTLVVVRLIGVVVQHMDVQFRASRTSQC